MVYGGQKHKIGICKQNLRTETCGISYMTSLGGYPSETIAFRCFRCFRGLIFGSKHEK